MVVDVREPGEWREGHIAGALHLPMLEAARAPELSARDRPKAVMCAGGLRSSTVISALKRHGVSRLPQRHRRHDRLAEGRSAREALTDESFDYPRSRARSSWVTGTRSAGRRRRDWARLGSEADHLPGLIPGMDVVGEKFRRNEYYVPQVLLSARAMYAGLDLLKPLLTAGGRGATSTWAWS